jgi:signal transduction histidine kinase
VGDIAIAQVWRTGRAARIADHDGVAGVEKIPRKIGAAVSVPIVVEGRPWGVLLAGNPVERLPADTEERLAPFCELVAVAIANADYRTQLKASRARIVASADEARRRLERDVHDGAQQRLVHTLITLKQAQAALQGSDSAVARLVDESLAQAEVANVQLRELANGILPAALARGGLRTGIASLLHDTPLRVDAEVLGERLPEAVETTAYFVIAEALTNVMKHAGANRARVRAVAAGDRLEVEVSDDGHGGADPANGSGLMGLIDRVDAAGGSMSVSSPEGAGTRLTVTLPIDQSEMQDRA